MEFTEIMEQEVKKHVAAIRVSNNVGLLARKTWNILLLNAYEELLTEQFHKIKLSVLFEVAGYRSKNSKTFENALDKLLDVGVKWDIGGGAEVKGFWVKNVGKSKMIASYEIVNGVLIYEYAYALKKFLYNPQMYKEISLSQQRKFKSSHALALWENCLRYVDVGNTGLSPLRDWRELLGAVAKTYDRYAYFRFKVLQPAIDEINDVSDIEVQLNEKKDGRKVLEIGFSVKIKKLSSILISELLETAKDSDEYKKMIELGITKIKALSYIQDYGYEYIREKIDLLHESSNDKNIKNPRGFLNAALKEDWKGKIKEEDNNIKDSKVFKTLAQFGISEEVAIKHIQEKGEEYIQEKILVVQEEMRVQHIRNPAGFLIRAIEKGYKSDELNRKQKEEKARLAQQKREEEEKRNKELKDKKTKLENDFGKMARFNFWLSRTEEEKEELIEKIEEYCLDKNLIRFKSPLQGLRDGSTSELNSMSIRVAMRNFIPNYAEDMKVYVNEEMKKQGYT